jgi:hypothetical protein
MTIRTYRVSNLLIWTCVASYVEFCLWETLGWKFCIFGLIHAFSTRGRSLSLKWLAGCIQKVLTGRGHRFDRSECWFCSHVAHQSDRWCWPVWPVRAELLHLPYFKWCLACIRPGGVALVQGELACVQGELNVVFWALVWWFALFSRA